ncbi:DUF481 domain-containing protein [Acerihabitans arboris]|uniref:DUF481 domain-containing protein n=1 Tax=Acerihabitans arboris TaxID=2691583 RepID=A0A845SCR9_9GAMM|nr:DUF481 domain-containing protein [Acerihabitans arboris]NDL62683.1 DUF481 domain-containing protein [Acerihabitans arboris]
MLRNGRSRAVWLMTILGMSLASFSTFADTDIFTALDDPSTAKKSFDGNVQAGYNAQSGNSTSSALAASSTMTWFKSDNAYSLWAEAANNSTDDERSSEKYQAGARARHNMDADNFLFTQGSWLSDRFNGYRSRDTLTAGYGRQVLNGPISHLRLEAGPGVRHDEFQGGGNQTKALAYGAASFTYQLTDSTQFIQGVSLLGNDDITANSETGLSVAINTHFALKMTYDVTYNSSTPDSAPKHTDTKTAVSLVYNMQ